MPVSLRPGSPGQLDVFVDDEKVAGRATTGFLRFLGGGFPDPAEVIAALRERLHAAG
ncbi:MAG: Rdx family protein [Acidobacteria bacterium]|nr:Rdx family protein [Acidobacteriota bacterium]